MTHLKTRRQLHVPKGAESVEIELLGHSKLALIVPAELDGFVATIEVFDELSNDWITTSATENLTPGFLVLSDQSQTIISLSERARLSLVGPELEEPEEGEPELEPGVQADCVLQILLAS